MSEFGVWLDQGGGVDDCAAGANDNERNAPLLTEQNLPLATHIRQYAAVIYATMAVVHLNYDSTSHEAQHLKRMSREILHNGNHRAGLDAEVDPTDAYVVISSIPNVLLAAVAVLKRDMPRHIISAAMLAHAAAEVRGNRLGDTYTAHLQHPPRNTIQFVAKAIEFSNVAYREFFDVAAVVVEEFAERYLDLHAVDRAEVELVVRAHVALDAFSLALSERVAAEVVLEYAQITKQSQDVKIDARACDLLSSNCATPSASRRRESGQGQEPIENPEEPSCTVNQLRVGGMIAALVANAARKEQDRQVCDAKAGRVCSPAPWLAHELERIDRQIRMYTTNEWQQAGDEYGAESPARFGKLLKLACMEIVVRLCDEITGIGPNTDLALTNVRLFVAIFNDVPCLNGPDLLADNPNLTIFDAAHATSKALDGAGAPRHSAVATVTAVLAFLGPAVLTPHPSGATRGYAPAENTEVPYFSLDDVFQVMGGPIDTSATIGHIRSKYHALDIVVGPVPSIVGGTHEYLKGDRDKVCNTVCSKKGKSLFRASGRLENGRPLLRVTHGVVTVATRQPTSADRKAARTIAALNFQTLLLSGGVLAIDNDIDSAPSPRPSGRGQTCLAIVVRKLHAGAGRVLFESPNTVYIRKGVKCNGDELKLLDSEDEYINSMNAADVLLQGLAQEATANGLMRTCEWVYDKLDERYYTFTSPARDRATTSVPTHMKLTTMLIQHTATVLDEACACMSLEGIYEKGLGEALARQVLALAKSRSVKLFAHMWRRLLDDNSRVQHVLGSSDNNNKGGGPDSLARASKRQKSVRKTPEEKEAAKAARALVALLGKQATLIMTASRRIADSIEKRNTGTRKTHANAQIDKAILAYRMARAIVEECVPQVTDSSPQLVRIALDEALKSVIENEDFILGAAAQPPRRTLSAPNDTFAGLNEVIRELPHPTPLQPLFNIPLSSDDVDMSEGIYIFS